MRHVFPATPVSAHGLPYPQLLRAARLAWWRPLWALALGALGYAAWLGTMRWGLAVLPATAAGDALQGPVAQLAVLNLALAGLLPASLLAMRLGLGQAVGRLGSVQGRWRWHWLLRAWLVAAPCIVLLAALDLCWLDPRPWAPEPQALALVVVMLLLTPLQCAGEEVVFRGLLPQCLGAWCAGPRSAFWLTLVLPAVLFAAVHGAQNAALFAARFGMGLLFGWLAWRTGGLEAPLALHTLNNQTAFAEAIASGTLQQALFASDASAAQAVVQLAVLALTAALMLRCSPRTTAAVAVPQAPAAAPPDRVMH